MNRHLRWLAIALVAFAGASSASDVLMYRAGDRPDPQAMAEILSRPLKMRSIRMLPDLPADAAASGGATTPSAADPGKPASAPMATAAEATRPVVATTPDAVATADSFAMPVPFAFDSARILPEASAQLEAVVAAVKLTSPDVHVLIEGHTDAIGSDEYNTVLSLRRAEAVKTYLVARGIAADRLHVVGMGKAMPLDPRDPKAAENRRVQFRALGEAERMAGSSPRHG